MSSVSSQRFGFLSGWQPLVSFRGPVPDHRLAFAYLRFDEGDGALFCLTLKIDSTRRTGAVYHVWR